MKKKMRLYNSKHNLLTDKYRYSCIVGACEYHIIVDRPWFETLNDSAKLYVLKDRDSSFINHMIDYHYLQPLFTSRYLESNEYNGIEDRTE